MATGTIVMLFIVLGIFGTTFSLLVHTVNRDRRQNAEQKN